MPIVESVTTFGAVVGRISDIVQTGDTLTATGTVGPEPHSWIGQASEIVVEGIKNGAVRAIGKHVSPWLEAWLQWVVSGVTAIHHADWHAIWESVSRLMSNWDNPPS